MFMPCSYGVSLQLIFNVLQFGSFPGKHQQHVGPLAKSKFDHNALLVRITEVHVVASVCHERYLHSGLLISPEVLHGCLFGLEGCSPIPWTWLHCWSLYISRVSKASTHSCNNINQAPNVCRMLVIFAFTLFFIQRDSLKWMNNMRPW